jgi:hypothetical protein
MGDAKIIGIFIGTILKFAKNDGHLLPWGTGQPQVTQRAIFLS